jgi:plastocyanin
MRTAALAVATATTLLLSACDGGDAADTPDPAESPTAVEVEATEYAFDLPAEVEGGVVTMRFTNTGGLPHEFAFARIEEGKTEEDVREVIESGEEPPPWADDIAGVPGLSPGESVTVTRTLEPGSYAFLCFFPDPEGTPHAALGMYEVFSIVGDSGASLPEADATITATDEGLDVPTFDTGEQTVEFVNDGSEPHELLLVEFEPGSSVRDVDRWIGGGYRGEPPATFLGGMQTIPSGESVLLTLDLEAGVEYTALDFSTRSRETFEAS